MIQRKQTIFLMLALAAIIVCLCLPVGTVDPKGSGPAMAWYNFGSYVGSTFIARPLLFIDLVVTGALTFITIFLYNHRKMQMGLCVGGIILCLAWYGYFIFSALADFSSQGTFHVKFGVCLPAIAIICLAMARHGIKADEELIKSMDRIR